MGDLNAVLEHALQGNLFLAFGAVFLAGVLTSFTPCVYPMIPITVGIVGGRATTQTARQRTVSSLMYVLGVALTYASLGLIASLTGRMFGEISTNPWIYLIVGNICLLFGLSTLEVFFIEFPFQSKLAAFKWGQGWLSALGMGLISGLIAGPCTAPVLGSLLVFVGLKQNVLFGTTLLFTFAVGMTTLLLIAGLSAGFLAHLPKSGNWMVRVKKISGYLMIAIAEYFFIQAGKVW